MKTFAELAETPAPEDIDSDSFVSTLTGNPPEKKWARNSRLYWEFHERGSAQAVRFGKWKAIRKPMFTGPIELKLLKSSKMASLKFLSVKENLKI